MEIVALIDSIEDIALIDNSKVTRIYYGEEFCERLIPNLETIKKIKAATSSKGLKFSFVTPVVTDLGLERINEIMKIIDDHDEIIVNDIGVLNLIHTTYKNPINIGRVLGRKFIEIFGSFEDEIKMTKDYIFTYSDRIKIIETDYLKSKLISKHLASELNFAFYNIPFFWTMTRRCAFNRNTKSLKKFEMCKKECLTSSAIITNTSANKDFLLKGNKMLDVNSAKGKIDVNLFKRIIMKIK